MGEDSVAFTDLRRFLDERQVVIAEVAWATHAQAGGRTTQHDLVCSGYAGRLYSSEGIALIELKDLLNIARIVHVIIEHHVVSTVALEEPPVLRDADRHRIDAQLADAISVTESFFPAPVFILADE